MSILHPALLQRGSEVNYNGSEKVPAGIMSALSQGSCFLASEKSRKVGTVLLLLPQSWTRSTKEHWCNRFMYTKMKISTPRSGQLKLVLGSLANVKMLFSCLCLRCCPGNYTKMPPYSAGKICHVANICRTTQSRQRLCLTGVFPTGLLQLQPYLPEICYAAYAVKISLICLGHRSLQKKIGHDFVQVIHVGVHHSKCH